MENIEDIKAHAEELINQVRFFVSGNFTDKEKWLDVNLRIREALENLAGLVVLVYTDSNLKEEVKDESKKENKYKQLKRGLIIIVTAVNKILDNVYNLNDDKLLKDELENTVNEFKEKNKNLLAESDLLVNNLNELRDEEEKIKQAVNENEKLKNELLKEEAQLESRKLELNNLNTEINIFKEGNNNLLEITADFEQVQKKLSEETEVNNDLRMRRLDYEKIISDYEKLNVENIRLMIYTDKLKEIKKTVKTIREEMQKNVETANVIIKETEFISLETGMHSAEAANLVAEEQKQF